MFWSSPIRARTRTGSTRTSTASPRRYLSASAVVWGPPPACAARAAVPPSSILQGGVVTAKIGDRVVVEAEGTSRTSRHGVIEEILQEQPPRLRIQWDDGRESIL